MAYLPPSMTDKALGLFDSSPSHPPPLERIFEPRRDEEEREERLAVDEDFGVLPEALLTRWRRCARDREALLSQLKVSSRKPLPPVRRLLINNRVQISSQDARLAT